MSKKEGFFIIITITRFLVSVISERVAKIALIEYNINCLIKRYLCQLKLLMLMI
jgi:hypothetical protein